MKTSNLIFGLCFMASSTFGQINLENSYTSDCLLDSPIAFNVESGTKFYNLSSSENKVKIYNSSHTLEKSISLSITTGFSLEKIYLPCDKLFNSDSKIEFIAVVRSDTETKMILFDEDGANLKDFGSRWEAYYIKTMDNTFKLITISGDKSTPTYDVYSLPGVLSETQQILLNKKELKAFPNPVSDELKVNNILKNGENSLLEIFNESGIKVLQKNISSNEDIIRIDVSSLKAGLYIYKINNSTDKFIKR